MTTASKSATPLRALRTAGVSGQILRGGSPAVRDDDAGAGRARDREEFRRHSAVKGGGFPSTSNTPWSAKSRAVAQLSFMGKHD